MLNSRPKKRAGVKNSIREHFFWLVFVAPSLRACAREARGEVALGPFIPAETASTILPTSTQQTQWALAPNKPQNDCYGFASWRTIGQYHRTFHDCSLLACKQSIYISNISTSSSRQLKRTLFSIFCTRGRWFYWKLLRAKCDCQGDSRRKYTVRADATALWGEWYVSSFKGSYTCCVAMSRARGVGREWRMEMGFERSWLIRSLWLTIAIYLNWPST